MSMDIGGHDIILDLPWKDAYWDAIVKYFARVWPDGSYLDNDSTGIPLSDAIRLRKVAREFFIWPPASHDHHNDYLHFIGTDKELTVVVDNPESFHKPRIMELASNLNLMWWCAP